MKKKLKKGFLTLALIFTLIGFTTLKNNKISALELNEQDELFLIYDLNYYNLVSEGRNFLVSNGIGNIYYDLKDLVLKFEFDIDYNMLIGVRCFNIDNEVISFLKLDTSTMFLTIPSNVYSFKFIFDNAVELDVIEFVDEFEPFEVYNYTLMLSYEDYLEESNKNSYDEGFNLGYNEGLKDAPPLEYPEPITDNIVSDYLLLLDNLIVEPIYLYLLEFDIDISVINFSPGFGSVTWFNISLINIIRIIFGVLGIWLIVRIFYKLIKRFFRLILGGFTI